MEILQFGGFETGANETSEIEASSFSYSVLAPTTSSIKHTGNHSLFVDYTKANQFHLIEGVDQLTSTSHYPDSLWFNRIQPLDVRDKYVGFYFRVDSTVKNASQATPIFRGYYGDGTDIKFGLDVYFKSSNLYIRTTYRDGADSSASSQVFDKLTTAIVNADEWYKLDLFFSDTSDTRPHPGSGVLRAYLNENTEILTNGMWLVKSAMVFMLGSYSKPGSLLPTLAGSGYFDDYYVADSKIFSPAVVAIRPASGTIAYSDILKVDDFPYNHSTASVLVEYNDSYQITQGNAFFYPSGVSTAVSQLQNIHAIKTSHRLLFNNSSFPNNSNRSISPTIRVNNSWQTGSELAGTAIQDLSHDLATRFVFRDSFIRTSHPSGEWSSALINDIVFGVSGGSPVTGSYPYVSQVALQVLGSTANTKYTTLYIEGGIPSSGIPLFLCQELNHILVPSGDLRLGSGSWSSTNSQNSWSQIDETTGVENTHLDNIYYAQSGVKTNANQLYFGVDHRLNKVSINGGARSIVRTGSDPVANIPSTIEIDKVNDWLYHIDSDGLNRVRLDGTDNTLLWTLTEIEDAGLEIPKYLTLDDENGLIYIGGQDRVLKSEKHRSSLTSVISSISPDTIHGIRYSSKNDRLYVLRQTTSVGPLRLIEYNVPSGTSVVSANLTPIISTGNQCYDFDIDDYNKAFYIRNNLITYKYNCSTSGLPHPNSSVGTAIETNTDNGTFYLGVDRRASRLYSAYSTASSGVIRRQNTDGTNTTTLLVESGVVYNDLTIDAPIFRTYAEFSLTDLPAAWESIGNPLQVVNSAYVRIRGQELQDTVWITPTLYDPTRTDKIWNLVGPYSGKFSTGSGSQYVNIGHGQSTINETRNTLTDWNNAILRLDFASLEDVGPSGIFRLDAVDVFVSASGEQFHGVVVSTTGTLYICGKDTPSGAITLFMPGQLSSSGLPLYMTGHSTKLNILDLYIDGTIPSGAMNLYLEGPRIYRGSGGIDLSVYSTSGQYGTFGQTSLYMETAGFYSPNDNMILYMNAHGPLPSASASMPLHIGRGAETLTSAVPFFLSNLAAASGLNLTIKGKGFSIINTGSGDGVPHNDAMALFINRPNESAATSLVVWNSKTENNIPLSIFGTVASSSGIPLYMERTASGNSNVSLYTSGF